MGHDTIDAWHAAQASADRPICDLLRAEIDRHLTGAESRVWHAHPVWFLSGNPIVGYSKLKHCVRLLFWSGQSFEAPGLSAEGSFKAAEKRFTAPDQIDRDALRRWLVEAQSVQWDYRNIVKRKGKLVRLL
ncbi:protein of unknown function (DU1801) [Cribrihabitans marinus]|uniref:YdhG-like domain-containing protein n=1 Tax=Cribrihabitans marinus TaxID=1227549 RepID=A0A1H6ZVN9_9RHOB|nr:DUF1801 domain-containing protein [Cribrihabitans marinus]GGH29922.1 hypothetical protein GCM10010973_19710 [Cribrihabitans marinus]SEJ57308.1 protein of unknown function (DU1801) [Cribrihabitans marinus]